VNQVLAAVRSCVVIAALWALCVTGARAQEVTATIRGVVTDPSGSAVPRAQISAVETETGLTRQTTADDQGAYLLMLLPVGKYRLEASAKGFERYVQEGIKLSVNQVATVPIPLKVGSMQESVVVKADVVQLSTSSDLGKTVLEREIVDLPLNGRDFSQLGLLQPGVVPVTQGLKNAGGPLRAGQAYSVNGLRPESNQFLIDGVENFDMVYGGYVLEPPIDAISEFRILTNTASAEFGHSAGSTTNIVTRSGSNRLHGSAYDFLRNDTLDARNFFAPTVEPLKQNQFGGAVGGPIRQDKTFLFGYFEGFRNVQGETFTSTVPSALEREGDFSQTVDASSGQVLPLIDETTGDQYPNNKLPAINSISQNLLKYYPLPNVGTNLYTTTQSLRSRRDQFGLRVDHHFSSQDSLFVRYDFSNGSEFDPIAVSGATVPGFPVQESDRSQTFVVEETRSFSATVVNVARLSFLRHKLLDVEGLNHADPSTAGFQFPTTLPSQNGLPYINIPGYGNIGDPLTGPRNTYQNSLTAQDSLTWLHGKHQFQFGGGIRHDQINAVQGIASNGYFVFGTFPVSNSFASFLDGAPEVFLQGGGYLPRGLRGNSFNGYAQDTFKATRKLTFNLGVRYELQSPFMEIHNQQILWIPGKQSVVHPEAPVGLLYPGDPGVPRGLIATDYHGFAPRVGLAWDPTGSGKWVVRSAYGIFYDPLYNGQGGPLQDIISSPPWFKILQIGQPDYANPTAGINALAPGYNYPELFDALDPNLRLPYAQDWNLTVQRSFGSGWIAEVA